MVGSGEFGWMARMPRSERAGLSRRAAGALVLGIGLALAACSSGPSGEPATPTTGSTHAALIGRSVLGANLASWTAAHAPITVAGTPGYGSIVTVDGRKVPEFTSLVVRGGRVVGWHLSFGPGTLPAAAESLVRGLLPTDAQQTASWTGPSGGSKPYCEFVNFRSRLLGAALGQQASEGASGDGDIGVALSDRAPGQAGQAGRVVTSAVVGTRARVHGQGC